MGMKLMGILLMIAHVWAWPSSTILSTISSAIVGVDKNNATTKCWGGCDSEVNTVRSITTTWSDHNGYGGLMQDFPSVCQGIQSFSIICANTVIEWQKTNKKFQVIQVEVHRMATSGFDLFQQYSIGCGTCQKSRAFQFQSAVQGFFIVMQSIISILVERYNSHLDQCFSEFELISASIHAITGIAHSLDIDLGSILMSIGINLLLFDSVNIDLRAILNLPLSGLFGVVDDVVHGLLDGGKSRAAELLVLM